MKGKIIEFLKTHWWKILLMILVLLIAVISFFAYQSTKQKSSLPPTATNPNNQSGQFSKYYSFTSACRGTGRKILTTAPINLDVIRSVWPLGHTGGADVIASEDHDFFFKNLDMPPNSYTVVSPASGVIVMVNEHHTFAPAGGSSVTGYEVMIAHTCTQYSAISSLSSVDPKVKEGQPISEGQVVGKVGGNHGFGFAVLDTLEPNHYVVPEHYEPLKLYGKNAFDYFSNNLKATLEAKSLRKASPRGGTLGIDQDGKLIGNWQRAGTGGFINKPNSTDYFKNFLSFAYDFIDPGHLRFSLGDYLGQPRQFGVKNNGPDPTTVSLSSGLIKYELVDYHYKNETVVIENENTDSFDPANVYKPVNDEPVIAVLFVQLTADRTLKMEIFPGKTADQVSGFTYNAQIYER